MTKYSKGYFLVLILFYVDIFSLHTKFIFFMFSLKWFVLNGVNWWFNAWKVSKYRIFSGPYFSTFGLNTDHKKTRIWTHFMQWLWQKPVFLWTSAILNHNQYTSVQQVSTQQCRVNFETTVQCEWRSFFQTTYECANSGDLGIASKFHF